MRRIYTAPAVALLYLLCMQSRDALAQRETYRWQASLQGASLEYSPELQVPQTWNTLLGGFRLSRAMGLALATGVELQYLPPRAEAGNVGLWYGGIHLDFHWDNDFMLDRRSIIAPYHRLRAGLMEQAAQTEGLSVAASSAVVGLENGLKFRLGDRYSAEISYLVQGRPVDLQGSGGSFYSGFGAALSYHFGLRKSNFKAPVFWAHSASLTPAPPPVDQNGSAVAPSAATPGGQGPGSEHLKRLSRSDSLRIFMHFDSLYTRRSRSDTVAVYLVAPPVVKSNAHPGLKVDSAATASNARTAAASSTTDTAITILAPDTVRRSVSAHEKVDSTLSPSPHMRSGAHAGSTDSLRQPTKGVADTLAPIQRSPYAAPEKVIEKQQLQPEAPADSSRSTKKTPIPGGGSSVPTSEGRKNAEHKQQVIIVPAEQAGKEGANQELLEQQRALIEEQKKLLQVQQDALNQAREQLRVREQASATPGSFPAVVAVALPASPTADTSLTVQSDSVPVATGIAASLVADSLNVAQQDSAATASQEVYSAAAPALAASGGVQQKSYAPADTAQVPFLLDSLTAVGAAADASKNSLEKAAKAPPVATRPDAAPTAALVGDTAVKHMERVVVSCYFALNKATASAEELEKLQALIAVAKKDTLRQLRVTGFTDSSGAPGYNQSLSAERAQHIAGYLRDAGIAAERISVRAAGVSTNAATYAPDRRRVEVVLLR